jgi:hypothetical protein
MIVGRVGKFIDPVLLHHEPLTVPEMLADCAFEVMGGLENYCCHLLLRVRILASLSASATP